MKKTGIAWTRVENSGKKNGGQSERRSRAPYKRQLRRYSQSNEEYVVCHGNGNGKKLVKKIANIAWILACLLPSISDIVKRAHENNNREVTASARGWVFFSSASHSLSRTALIALALCQIVKKKEKKRKANKQPTNNKNKEKEKLLWADYMNNGNFSNFFIIFFHLKEKARFTASEH